MEKVKKKLHILRRQTGKLREPTFAKEFYEDEEKSSFGKRGT